MPLELSHDLQVDPSGFRILRVRCAGTYDHDGEQIRAFGAQVLVQARADAVLLDFTRLDYSYGDDLLLAFDIPFYAGPHPDLPLAVLAGPSSHASVSSLVEHESSVADSRESDFIFREEAAAFDWLSCACHAKNA